MARQTLVTKVVPSLGEARRNLLRDFRDEVALDARVQVSDLWGDNATKTKAAVDMPCVLGTFPNLANV
jgi:hypothetical protein